MMRMNKMPGQQKLAEALRIANGMIERAVTEAFNHLDAATHSVEIRKQLHAIFVQRAIELAEIRFPENGALRSALGRIGASFTPEGKLSCTPPSYSRDVQPGQPLHPDRKRD